MTEDLTEPRRKLLRDAKEMPGVEFAYIKDGTILAKQRRGSFIRVETADDFFQLGAADMDYSKYYKLE